MEIIRTASAHGFRVMPPMVCVVVDVKRNGIMGLVRGWVQWDIVNFVEFNVADDSIEFSGSLEFEGRAEEGIGRWQDELFWKSWILDGLYDGLEARQVQHDEEGNTEVCRTDKSRSG